jgi:hypothetical protein
MMTYIIRDDIHSNELNKYEFIPFVSCVEHVVPEFHSLHLHEVLNYPLPSEW